METRNFLGFGAFLLSDGDSPVRAALLKADGTVLEAAIRVDADIATLPGETAWSLYFDSAALGVLSAGDQAVLEFRPADASSLGPHSGHDARVRITQVYEPEDGPAPLN